MDGREGSGEPGRSCTVSGPALRRRPQHWDLRAGRGGKNGTLVRIGNQAHSYTGKSSGRVETSDFSLQTISSKTPQIISNLSIEM